MSPAEASQQGICENLDGFMAFLCLDDSAVQCCIFVSFSAEGDVFREDRMVLAAVLCGCPVPTGGILYGWGAYAHCHCRQRGGTECRKGWLCVPVSLQLSLLSGQNVVGACSILGCRVRTHPSFLSTHFQPNTVTSCPPSPPIPVSLQPEEWGTEELLCCRAPVAPGGLGCWSRIWLSVGCHLLLLGISFQLFP